MDLNIVLSSEEIQEIEEHLWQQKGKVSDEQIIYEIDNYKRRVLQVKRQEAKNSGPTLDKLYDYILDFVGSDIVISDKCVDPKFSLIYGDCQTGKRGEILGHAIRSLKQKKQVIIVTDNFKVQKIPIIDSIQNGIASFNKMYNSNNNVAESRFSLSDVMYVNGSLYSDDWKDKAQTTNFITVCMMNSIQLSTVNTIIKESQTDNFNVIFDEADVGTVDDIYNRERAQRVVLTQNIMARDNVNTLFVTATWLSILAAVQKNVKLIGKNIHSIKQNKFIITTEHKNAKKFEIDEYLEEDGSLGFKSLGSLVGKFTHYPWAGGNVRAGVISTSKFQKDHKDTQEYLSSNFKCFCVVVNNGSSKIFYPKFNNKRKKEIEVNGSVSDSLNIIKTYWLNKCKKNGKKYDINLFVIGGNMIERAQSCRSELEEKPKNCFDMLICTNQVFTTNNKQIDNTVQGGKRWQGFYPFDENHKQPTTKIFATKKVLGVIYNHHKDVMTQIENFKENPYADIKVSVSAFSEEIGECKVCSNTKIRKQNNLKVDGEWYLTKESADIAKANVQDSGEECGEVEPRGRMDASVIIEKFRQSITQTTSIAKFVRSLENKSYTKTQILKILEDSGYKQPAAALSMQVNGNYGTLNIMEKIGSKYRIMEEYQEAHNSVFGMN